MYGYQWVNQKQLGQKRIEIMKPFQVNKETINLTNNKHVKFMHCLPAFHNDETIVGKELLKNMA